MWKITKKDGSAVEIERDNSLVIYKMSLIMKLILARCLRLRGAKISRR